MYWRILRQLQPQYGERCVVKRLHNNKAQSGVFLYTTAGWQSSSGHISACDSNDRWCPLQDIVNNVADRIVSEMQAYR